MKHLIFLALLASLPAGAKENRTDLTDRIEYACNVRLRVDYKNHREICACVSGNLEAELKTKDLELLARSHEEEKEAEEELQQEKHNDLILFDYEVTESCLENPKWKYGK